MLKIKLLNMPFGALRLPSIALTQLKSVVDQRFKDRVSVEVCYLNHDFGSYLGIGLYSFIAYSSEANNAGLGDWFFRRAAFPHLPNNAEEYFRRYFPRRHSRVQLLCRTIQEKRDGAESLLDQLIDKYELEEADMVGLTSMFAQNVACFALARKLKERVPGITIVMGGANCEPPMGEEIIKNIQHIDYVFSGAALKAFPDFVERRLLGDSRGGGNIRGVLSRASLKGQLFGPAVTLGEDLDINIPVELDYAPFLSALDATFTDGKIEPSLLFETSRGCWWGERSHCTFCGLNGSTMKYRGMDSGQALRQFEALFKYSPRVGFFECVDNIMPKNFPKEVFSFLRPPPNISIFYEVKSDLDEGEVEILSRAGVKAIQPGIESLATSTLKLMKKGSTSFQNLTLLKNCVTYDLLPAWNFLIGFPGEGEKVYMKYVTDIPALAHLPPPTGVFPVRFDRFSPYFTQAREYGLDLHPLDFYEMIYPFTKSSLANLAYYFSDRNYSADYFVTMVKWIGRISKEVEQWKKKWVVQDQSLIPKLFLKNCSDTPTVYDSRCGEAVEHQIGTDGLAVLQALSKPKAISTLASQLGHTPDRDPEQTIAFLQERRLVFHEDGRFLSLVHPKEPPRLKALMELGKPSEWSEWSELSEGE